MKTKTTPECSHRLMGYGIGHCAGCERFPVVLYELPDRQRWRCERCCANLGVIPGNKVSL